MSTQDAKEAGYTEEYEAESGDHSMSMTILVQPDTDLDGAFRAWDVDNAEFVNLNGWNWTFERVEGESST